jgi:hypothetical protein
MTAVLALLRSRTADGPTPSHAVLRDRREAERGRALTDLLQRRPDLEGVHPAADLATEAIRWCA